MFMLRKSFVPAKSILPCLLLLAGFVEGVAAGQSGNGYVNIGVGSISDTAKTEVATGGEVVVAQTIGFGGEIGYAWSHTGFGLVSLDASLHLSRHAATGKVDPFIVGGYTRAFDFFSGANGANFGFGLSYWFAHHLGVRAEFRDTVFSAGTPTNFWMIRGGIAFR
jgi:hypothetical protein